MIFWGCAIWFFRRQKYIATIPAPTNTPALGSGTGVSCWEVAVTKSSARVSELLDRCFEAVKFEALEISCNKNAIQTMTTAAVSQMR